MNRLISSKLISINRFKFTILISCLFISAVVSAQENRGPFKDVVKIPATPASAHVKPFIDIMNSGNDTDLREFIKKHFGRGLFKMHSLNFHVNQLKEWARNSGGFNYHYIRIYEKEQVDRVTVIVNARKNGEWRALTIYIEKDEGIGGFDYYKVPDPKS